MIVVDRSLCMMSFNMYADCATVFVYVCIFVYLHFCCIRSNIPYVGTYVPTTLYNEIYQYCHCPTAVHCINLGYIDEYHNFIDVTCIGDPTAIGPNINSCDNDDVANFILGTLHQRKSNDAALQKAISDATRVGLPLRNVVVPAGYAYVAIKADVLNQARYGETEVLTKYEIDKSSSFFVQIDEENAYCDVCCLKFSEARNKLILCDVDDCLQGRHRQCFAQTLRIQDVTRLRHLCNTHMDCSNSPMHNILDSPSAASIVECVDSPIVFEDSRPIQLSSMHTPSSHSNSATSSSSATSIEECMQSPIEFQDSRPTRLLSAATSFALSISAPCEAKKTSRKRLLDDIEMSAATRQSIMKKQAQQAEENADGTHDDDSEYNLSVNEEVIDNTIATTQECGQRSISRRINGVDPIVVTPSAPKYKMRVANVERRVVAGGFVQINLSINQTAVLNKMILEHVSRNLKIKKCNKQRKIESIKIKDLMRDFSCIISCILQCGVMLSNSTHPFSAPEKLLHYRFNYCSSDQDLRLHAFTHLVDRSYDRDGRVITLEGHRVCQGCFQMAMGCSDSTIKRIHAKVVQKHTIIAVEDARTHMSGCGQGGATAHLVTVILKMIDDGLGQTLPTNEGGARNRSISMPFTTRTAFYKQILLYIVNMSGCDIEGVPAMLEIADKQVQPNLVRRALKFIEDKHHIAISIQRCIKFMKCTACSKFDNEKRRLIGSCDKQAMIKLWQKVNKHLQQVFRERSEFNKLKTIAK